MSLLSLIKVFFLSSSQPWHIIYLLALSTTTTTILWNREKESGLVFALSSFRLSEVRYWAWRLLVRSPIRQIPFLRWNEGDCPGRCLGVLQTPSPVAQLCRCGCQPSLAGGSRRSRVVPVDSRKMKGLKMSWLSFFFFQAVHSYGAAASKKIILIQTFTSH